MVVSEKHLSWARQICLAIRLDMVSKSKPIDEELFQ